MSRQSKKYLFLLENILIFVGTILLVHSPLVRVVIVE
jgi:hypothetical protein